MSTNLQSIVSAGISPTSLTLGAGGCADSIPAENPILRFGFPAMDSADGPSRQVIAEETTGPVGPSTSAAPKKRSPEEIRSRAVAEVANAGLLETVLAAKAVRGEVEVRLPKSPTGRNLRFDGPQKRQSHLIPDYGSVDLSAFTTSEEDLLRRCLNRSMPPAYVDAVIRIVSRSRDEMVEDLGQCLDHRTRQLHQAVNVIQNLIREKTDLQSKSLRLDQVRSHLNEIHATLRGVHREASNRETTR